jgi:hypothetical protein
MIFLVNFVNHVYQFPAPRWCAQCSNKCESYMVPFLEELLSRNNIVIALEEGGNPCRGGMRKARETWGFKKRPIAKNQLPSETQQT